MGTYIVLIGIQGSGKGTQAAILKEKLDLLHVSTGDLFRAMKTLDTPLARRVQDLMKAGELIPDDVTNQMVKDRLAEPDAARGVILDGYPRNLAQAAFLDQLLAAEYRGRLTVVPLLKLDRETAILRIEGRRYSQDGQRVYNVYFDPPQRKDAQGDYVDNEDGLPVVQRADDNREAVERRIDLFLTETAPLIEYYQSKGLLAEIEADQPVDKVAVDMIAAVARGLMAR
jgi:adenylate kinase